MKAEELRLGNLISYNRSNVSVIDIMSPRVRNNPYNGKYIIGIMFNNCSSIETTEENITGIPLTKEIFLKLGFTSDRDILFELPSYIQEKCKGDNGFKKSAFFFNNRVGINSWMDCQTRVCVKYVHQVQNLVYALTMEELKV